MAVDCENLEARDPLHHEHGTFERSASKMKAGLHTPPENLQSISKKAVGVYKLVESVIPQTMETNAVLGLWGMGGVGKTTLAKLLFNKLCPKFEYSCFVSEAKVIDGKLEDLRMKVKKRMHHWGKPMSLTDVEVEWKNIQEKKLILVLDDAANVRDVQLLKDIAHENSAEESRFIVTSRDENLLIQPEGVSSYQVPLLDQESAESLFLSYAFPKQEKPPESLKEFVGGMVAKCDGLPLTLEILGKCLGRRKEVEVWKRSLDALSTLEDLVGDEKLWAKLKLSYDFLEADEKEMFLDVACFFVESQYSLREAKCAWESLYYNSLAQWQNLVDLSLVYEVDDDSSLKMHQQLRDLGRKLALTSGVGGKCSREWRSEMAFKLLQSQEDVSDDLEEVATLRLDWNSSPAESGQNDVLIWENICKMKQLRYLESSSKIEMNERSEFPDGLVLLSWRGYAYELPFDPALHESMVGLKLDASTVSVKKHLSEKRENIPEARGVDSLPSNFGLLSSLQMLELTRCAFDSLPDSFGNLSMLQRLKILHCDNLMTLPETSWKLSKLEYLLIDCKRMHALPETFGKLSSLQSLYLHRCSLETLPDTFCNLSRLQLLELKHCGNVRTLPKKIGNLAMLEHLEISNCKSLRILPDLFGPFWKLTHLSIMHCSQLERFPESFPEYLKELRLYITGFPQIENLPDSLGRLTALDSLKIRLCCRLRALPESFAHLKALDHLEVDDCSRLQSLPESFGHLINLKHLEIKRCHQIETLPESFGNLSALEHLRITDCSKLKKLPESFGNLIHLVHLEIDDCSDLHSLPNSLGRVLALTHLKIRNCSKLEVLPESFGDLSSLKGLEISDCSTLRHLPASFGNLAALKHLEISNCSSLEQLPVSFGDLKALKRLQLNDCSKLWHLTESFEQLRSLNQLHVSKCFKLEKLPPLPETLAHLVIEWVSLTGIPDCIQRLPSLRILELKALPFLRDVPEWLEGVIPPVEPQCVFRKQEGKFNLQLEEKTQSMTHTHVQHQESVEWKLRVLEIEDLQAFHQLKYGYRGLVMGKYELAMDKVRAKEYKQALVHLNGILDLPDILARFIEFEDSDDHKFTLRDTNIVKRLMEDNPQVSELLQDFGSVDLADLVFSKAKEKHDLAMAKVRAKDYQGAYNNLNVIDLLADLDLIDLIEDSQYNQEFLRRERERIKLLLERSKSQKM